MTYGEAVSAGLKGRDGKQSYRAGDNDDLPEWVASVAAGTHYITLNPMDRIRALFGLRVPVHVLMMFEVSGVNKAATAVFTVKGRRATK